MLRTEIGVPAGNGRETAGNIVETAATSTVCSLWYSWEIIVYQYIYVNILPEKIFCWGFSLSHYADFCGRSAVFSRYQSLLDVFMLRFRVPYVPLGT